MKRQILFNLFLLTIFCVAPVFAQNEDMTLKTEFFRLNNLEVKKDEKDSNRLSNETSYLLEIFKPLLTGKGSVEVDVREKTLIVTDTKGRVKLIGELVKTLDDSGLSLNDLMSESLKEGEKIITETVKTNYIFPVTSCLHGKESPWMVVQGLLLFKPVKKLQVRIRSNKQNDKEVELTGTEKRVGLVKKIVALFDQPFLTELADYEF